MIGELLKFEISTSKNCLDLLMAASNSLFDPVRAGEFVWWEDSGSVI